jgi:AraC-like DNA-binding protein
MMTTPKSIPDIHFSNSRSPKLGIEIISLEALFRRGLDRLLTSPQRVHFYHIFLFTHGAGNHAIDFHNYAYDIETLFLVAKGQVQQFQINHVAKGLIVIFTSEFLYENATELDLAHGLRVFEHALFSPCLRLTSAQRALFINLGRVLEHEYQKATDELSSEILRHLLRILLLHIERIQQASTRNQRVAPHYQEFVAFHRLVERDLAQSRSVQYYARQLANSPKKLNSLTRQTLNKTAKEFIEKQVILEARRLLAQGNLPIKEIAYQLGFSEPTNLVKFFKKHTRTSPAAFRQQFQLAA